MITLFSTAVSIWRVLSICVPIVISSAGAAYLWGYREGQLAERLDVAQAGARDAQAWSRWLTNIASKDGAFDADLRSVSIANAIAAQRVDDASRVPGNECLSPDFLRALSELR